MSLCLEGSGTVFGVESHTRSEEAKGQSYRSKVVSKPPLRSSFMPGVGLTMSSPSLKLGLLPMPAPPSASPNIPAPKSGPPPPLPKLGLLIVLETSGTLRCGWALGTAGGRLLALLGGENSCGVYIGGPAAVRSAKSVKPRLGEGASWPALPDGLPMGKVMSVGCRLRAPGEGLLFDGGSALGGAGERACRALHVIC